MKIQLIAGEPTFWCPGCTVAHRVNAVAPNPITSAQWLWNGDYDLPTFAPNVVAGTCKSDVVNGFITFDASCEHSLAGQTVEIPEWPYSTW